MTARARTTLFVSSALAAALCTVLVPGTAGAQPPGPARSGSQTPPALPAPQRLPLNRAANPKPTIATDHVLVRYRAGTSALAQARSVAATGAAVVDGLRGGYVSVTSAQGPAAEVAALSQDPNVAWTGYDYIRHAALTPNDPGFTQNFQQYLRTVQLPTAWATDRGSLSQVVAVVDTGVYAANPDLAGRVLPGHDFANNDTDPTDDNGHGTMVAGIAAANTNNGIGIAGAAWTARILPVKVLDSHGSGLDSNIAEGVEWAADHGATVINLSLAGPGQSAVLHDAVAYAVGKGIPVVAAAGNTGNSTPQYPGADPLVISVGATDVNGGIAAFSTFGDWVDVSAPGVDITSTYKTGYASGDGTSFSSPLVAGIVALVRTQNPSWTPARIATDIERSASPMEPPGLDPYYGFGVVNAAAAVGARRIPTLASFSDDIDPDVPQFPHPIQDGTYPMSPPGDVDWFVQAAPMPTAGQGWTVTVHPIESGDAQFADQLDADLSVYDASLHLLAGSTTPIDTAGDVRVSVFAPGGNLFVRVANLNGSSVDYSLSSVANGTTGTPTTPGLVTWVTDTTPRSGALNESPLDVPSITFGRSMDTSTLDATTVVLRDGVTGNAVAGTPEYTPVSGVLSFTPDAPLLTGVSYALLVTGAKDTLGNLMPELRLPFVVGNNSVRPPTGLTASGGAGQVTLAWTNPELETLSAATIWYATGDTPPAWGNGTVAMQGFRDSFTVSGLDSTRDYSFSVFAQSMSLISPAATVTVKGSAPLVTVTPSPSVYLKPVTITATLRDAGTLAPEPDRSAAIYWRRTGTTAWTLIKVAQSDANGQVTAVSTPRWNAQYYVHDLGGLGRFGAAVTVSHAVDFDVSSRQSASLVNAGHTVTLTAVVAPAGTGSPVLLDGYWGGSWHLMGTGTLNANSAFAFPVTLRSAATYTFRFVKAGNTLLGTGVSPSFTVRAV